VHVSVIVADYYCWRIWRWSWETQIQMYGGCYIMFYKYTC